MLLLLLYVMFVFCTIQFSYVYSSLVDFICKLIQEPVMSTMSIKKFNLYSLPAQVSSDKRLLNPELQSLPKTAGTPKTFDKSKTHTERISCSQIVLHPQNTVEFHTAFRKAPKLAICFHPVLNWDKEKIVKILKILQLFQPYCQM